MSNITNILAAALVTGIAVAGFAVAPLASRSSGADDASGRKRFDEESFDNWFEGWFAEAVERIAEMDEDDGEASLDSSR